MPSDKERMDWLAMRTAGYNIQEIKDVRHANDGPSYSLRQAIDAAIRLAKKKVKPSRKGK